jgi:hypothetical protein
MFNLLHYKRISRTDTIFYIIVIQTNICIMYLSLGILYILLHWPLDKFLMESFFMVL